MQIELSTEELTTVVNKLTAGGSGETDLEARLIGILAEAIELESMDFDDCAGGACKL